MDISQLTHIFCQIDDFCKDYERHAKNYALPSLNKKRKTGPSCSLSDSEIMTIMIAFQSSSYRHFKAFYQGYLQAFFHKEFPSLPSYQRYIELLKRVLVPLTLFSQVNAGRQTGIYYIDSTSLPVCHSKRARRNKVFKQAAEHGRTSVCWFFGLKLHLVINDRGELMAFKITKGNQHDSKAAQSLLESLNGLAFGDKGYLGKSLFENLLKGGLKLITRVRKNMKSKPRAPLEQQLLDQRGIIETVIGHLKHHYHVWHTRHRSVINAITHLMAALAAYTIEPLSLSAIKLINHCTV